MTDLNSNTHGKASDLIDPSLEFFALDVGPTPVINETEIRAHVELLHERAALIETDGKLVVSGFGQNPVTGEDLAAIIRHFPIGDVDGNVQAFVDLSQQEHRNIYMPLAVMRPDLPDGKKGREEDVLVSLGLIADFDDERAADYNERLPVPADFVIETSDGRFQTGHIFDEPIIPEEAKALSIASKTYAECDHGTADISHVWRVPGTLNWPNKKKVDEGRSPAPQLVLLHEPWSEVPTVVDILKDALSVTEAIEIGAICKQSAPTDIDVEALLKRLPDFIPEKIKAVVPEGGRSEAIFNVCALLIEKGLSDEEGAAVITAHPAGIGEKLSTRPDPFLEALKEMQRTRTRCDEAILAPPVELPPPYPIDALPDCMKAAIEGIYDKVQAPLALCGNSVLGAMALAAQGHGDVSMPSGKISPICLFIATVAQSGDRKSTTDGVAMTAIYVHAAKLREKFDRDMSKYRDEFDAWTAERKKIKNNKKLDKAAKEAAFLKLGSPPKRPREPILLASDPTVEGLIGSFNVGQPSMGLFSDEGGTFFGGYGMQKEHRLKTAAALSKFWDGDPIDRIRRTDDTIILAGRRLSLHLMMQPGVALEALNDPVMRDQGWLSRVLVSHPESLIGERPFHEPSAGSLKAIDDFSDRLGKLFSKPHLVNPVCEDELLPHPLVFSPLARNLWIEFYNEIEAECKDGGKYESIRGFAAKAAEHASRIAAVIALFKDEDAVEMDVDSFKSAVALTRYYLDEALRMAARPSISAEEAEFDSAVNTVRQWFKNNWKETHISAIDLSQRGPKSIRKQAKSIIEYLVELDELELAEGPVVIKGKKRNTVYLVIR